MAKFMDSARVTRELLHLPFWDDRFIPGQKVETSGIYYCTGCDKEYCLNQGNPFPAQNTEQHPASCSKIEWALLVLPK